MTKDKRYPIDSKDVSVEQLLDVIKAESAVERVAYRRQITTTNRQSFVRIDKGDTGQAQHIKSQSTYDSPVIGFKHLRYEVAESSKYVVITIEKKVPDQMMFKIRTIDGTAVAGQDYEAFFKTCCMMADEKEKDVKIGIMDDNEWEPDKEFKVQILEDYSEKRLPGRDTECTILI